MIKSYGRQTIDDDDVQAVISALKSDYLTTGPFVDSFEERLVEYCGSKYACVVSNGTAGLHLAMLALGLGKGDAVIVPSLTFAATSNAALYVGATPVFADISQVTWGLNVKTISDAYDVALGRGLTPKAVTVVHFGGMPVEIGPISKFCKEHGLFLIEDSCHALGSWYRQTREDDFSPVGCSDFSDLTVFSFHPVKPITTGEGGAVLTNDFGLSKKLKLLRSHGITRNFEDFRNRKRACDINGTLNPWYMEMAELGFNYRLSDILAALGISQFAKLENFIKRRREIAEIYRANLNDVDCLNLPPRDYDCGKSGYHLFSLEIDFKSISKTRSQVMQELKEFGVATQVLYLPVHWHEFYEKNPNMWLADDLTLTEFLYDRLLAIPLFPSLSDDQVNLTIDSLKKVVRRL